MYTHLWQALFLLYLRRISCQLFTFLGYLIWTALLCYCILTEMFETSGLSHFPRRPKQKPVTLWLFDSPPEVCLLNAEVNIGKIPACPRDLSSSFSFGSVYEWIDEDRNVNTCQGDSTMKGYEDRIQLCVAGNRVLLLMSNFFSHLTRNQRWLVLTGVWWSRWRLAPASAPCVLSAWLRCEQWVPNVALLSL